MFGSSKYNNLYLLLLIQNTFDFSGDGNGPCNAPVSENVYLSSNSSTDSSVKIFHKLFPLFSFSLLISHSSKIVGNMSKPLCNFEETLFF